LQDAYAAMFQELPLAGRNVLVQDVHARRGSTLESSGCRSSA
jgi:hypothetical protein